MKINDQKMGERLGGFALIALLVALLSS